MDTYPCCDVNLAQRLPDNTFKYSARMDTYVNVYTAAKIFNIPSTCIITPLVDRYLTLNTVVSGARGDGRAAELPTERRALVEPAERDASTGPRR